MKKILLVSFILIISTIVFAGDCNINDLLNRQKEALLKSQPQGTRHYFDPVINEVYPTYLTMPMLYSMFNCTSVKQEYMDSTGWVTGAQTWIHYDTGNQITDFSINANMMGQSIRTECVVTRAGGQISSIEVSWDYGGMESPMAKENYQWGTNGITSCTVQDYNPLSSTWMDSQEWTFTYNGTELTEVLIQEFGFDRIPENSEKYVLTYNAGHVDEMTYYLWDGSGWYEDENEIFVYDGDNMTEEIDQYWESGSWMNDEKSVYLYNGSMPVSWNDYMWDNDDWFNNGRGTITYNNDDLPTVFLSQTILYGAREWVDEGKLTYGYGDTGIEKEEISRFQSILSVYPNPFNPETNLSFTLEKDSNVELTIYNMKGQKVDTAASKHYNKGQHTVVWRGGSNSSGVYFAVLKTGSGTDTKKIIMMK